MPAADARLIFVIGTRAQLVKVAPVLNVVAARGVPHVVWYTGQHRESMDDLIADFGMTSPALRPARETERSTITSLFTWLPSALRNCVRHVRRVRRSGCARPVVVVHGDTLSTLLGAIAGRLAGAIVVHLESGLTSRRVFDPFPEELTRRAVFRLLDTALCPNADAAALMRARGRGEVIDTADNTILDSVRTVVAQGGTPQPDPARPLLVSVHRFQNIYDEGRLRRIVDDIVALSRHFPVTFVLHPATRTRLEKSGLLGALAAEPGIALSPRLPYSEFLGLAARAHVVITDGGSNQEELAYLGIPTVVLRDRSERPDGLGANAVLACQLGVPLVEYIVGGAVESIRRPSSLERASRPSEQTADVLERLLRDG